LRHKDLSLKLASDQPNFLASVKCIGHIIDAQFTLPLTEMRQSHLRMWQRLRVLPQAMLAAAGFLALGVLALRPASDFNFMFGPAPVRIGFGVALFATGVSLFLSAWTAPAHTFLRLA